LPGVPPDLDDLCVALLGRDPGDRPRSRAIMDRLGVHVLVAAANLDAAPSSVHPDAAIFLGRDAELDTLRRAFASSQKGNAEVVLIEGGSGMGKTALVSHFLDEAAAETAGTVVLRGRCHERESIPYKALDGVIDSLSRYLRTLPENEVRSLMPRNAALLPRLFPVLGRVEAISLAPRPKSETADAHLLRQRAFAALRELLFLCAERRSLIMWIDDLQWTDLDSLVALRELIRADDPPSSLLLLSSRATGSDAGDESDDALAAFIARLEPQTVRLALLSRDVSTQLAERLLAHPAATRQAMHVAAEANGHPLYIAELVRHALQASSITPTRVRLEDAIAARIAELPTLSRSILEVVCVAGAPLARGIVQIASKVAAQEFRKHLSILRVAHLVNSHGHRHEDAIEPYHDHVRQTVLSSLDRHRLRECHERLALALMTSTVAMRQEIVLLHLEGAGQYAQAAEYALEAAARAEKSFSFDLASRMYGTALRLGDYTRERQRELMVAHAEATAGAGRQPEAAHIFLTAAEGASAAESLDLRRRAAEAFLICGHLDDGVALLRRVLADVGVPAPSSKFGAMATLLLGRLRVRLRGLRFVEREESQVAPEELRRVDACWSAASGLTMSDTVLGMVFQTSHLRLALRSGEPSRITMALIVEAVFSSVRGRKGIPRAQALIRRSTNLAEASGNHRARLWASFGWGMSLYQVGRFKEAMRQWEQTRSLVEQMAGVHYERSTVVLAQVWSSYYLGDWRELSRLVTAELQAARDRGDLYSATNFATGIPSTVWLLRGQPDRARRLAREHVERWSRKGFHLQHYWEAFAVAQASLYRANAAAAWRDLEARWPGLSRSVLLRISMVLMEAHDLRARCAVAQAANLPEERSRYLHEARHCARRLKRPRLPVADALHLLLHAGISVVEGRFDRGVELLRRSQEAFTHLGMTGHLQVARWRMGDLIGGDEGAALIAGARAWMEAQQVSQPERMVYVITPWGAGN